MGWGWPGRTEGPSAAQARQPDSSDPRRRRNIQSTLIYTHTRNQGWVPFAPRQDRPPAWLHHEQDPSACRCFTEGFLLLIVAGVK